MKKVCKRGLSDIWINEVTGEVRMCGWSNFFIGSLVEQSIEEIWNGKLANEFRQSMLDGSYRYCNHSKCPHCANEELDNMLVDYKVPEYPEYCSLSYQLQCNYVCKFCRTSIYSSCDCEQKNYEIIEKEVKKIIPHLKTLSSNGAGEFFCSSSIIKLIQNCNINENTNIFIETNGSLFNEKNWQKISKLCNHHLTVAVTVHSFNNDTYQFLSGTKEDVSTVIANLKYISELRRANIINHFEIATVICERNFREMPEFVKKCLKEFSMDTIRLRFFEPYGVMDINTEWFYDVRNKYHPYHDEFVKVMNDDIFNNDKVWRWQGSTESLQKEDPYVLEHHNSVAFAKLLTVPDIGDKLKRFCELQHITNIGIYGVSDIGKSLSVILKNLCIGVYAFYDAYKCDKSYDNIVVYSPQKELLQGVDLMLISSEVFASQIKENLEREQFSGLSYTISELLTLL